MEFLTGEKAQERAAHTTGRSGYPLVGAPGYEVRRLVFANSPGFTYFAKARDIVASLGYFDWCLLWVVRTETRPSMENLHIYYRLRQSYGDRSMVHERPGLLAQRAETADLMSFLHVGLMSGWEMYLVTSHDHGRVFVSAEGYFDLSTKIAPAGEAEGEKEHAEAPLPATE